MPVPLGIKALTQTSAAPQHDVCLCVVAGLRIQVRATNAMAGQSE